MIISEMNCQVFGTVSYAPQGHWILTVVSRTAYTIGKACS